GSGIRCSPSFSSRIPLLLHTLEDLPECPASMENIRLDRSLGDSQHRGNLCLRVPFGIKQHDCESLSLWQRGQCLAESITESECPDLLRRVIARRCSHMLQRFGTSDSSPAAKIPCRIDHDLHQPGSKRPLRVVSTD